MLKLSMVDKVKLKCCSPSTHVLKFLKPILIICTTMMIHKAAETMEASCVSLVGMYHLVFFVLSCRLLPSTSQFSYLVSLDNGSLSH